MQQFINQIIQGDCVEVMKTMPDKSVDLIFADPPYNLQLKNELYRPDQSKVDGVFDAWDKFDSMQDYDKFTTAWLTECRRILKDNGSIWVIGSYHNIFRVGAIMQNLGFWLLNDVVWIKTNPMPNFKGTRFNNAHETLLWASKSEKSRYTFHYKSMKALNDDVQMRSDWYIPICQGDERIKVNGQKAHSTQKPSELLFRVILSTSNAGDLVLDPFNGSGTTAAVAKRLNRRFIGIERESFYVDVTRTRLEGVQPLTKDLTEYKIEHKIPKVAFGALVEKGMIEVGEKLYSRDKKQSAITLIDGSLSYSEEIGSIHKISALILKKTNNNGWSYWYVERNGQLVSIDELRYEYATNYGTTHKKEKSRRTLQDDDFKNELADIIANAKKIPKNEQGQLL